ncbi:MAG: SDR family NAD(P)-dependent oxidoreductase, partial [Acidiferrobacterales bacterium]
MSERLKDKVAVITGGGSGIGRAVCLAFAREGAGVGVVDRDNESATAVAQQINADGAPAALALQADITSSSDLQQMAASVREHFGHVDVLVNNAGSRIIKSFMEHTEADWRAMLDVNLTGHFLCTQAILPMMLERGNGRIINV